ncbi:hypothetical protein [Spiroplasma endosymbiont of Ammophila pubescens]|uniref:hypothetical protein n=1 Tax=Spiroplasma endosymbiont of Ammophila pubescens TaxID=3066315 RepID=UPI0032B1E137
MNYGRYNKTNDYFVGWIPEKESFNLEGIELNKTYELKFSISFKSPNQMTTYFCKEDLTLNFTQTAMYDRKIWLTKHVNYFTSKNGWFLGLWLDGWKVSNVKVVDELTSENIVNYTSNNIPLVKEKIKNKLNTYFQGSASSNDGWFYHDYKINVSVDSYQYETKLNPKNYPYWDYAYIQKVNLTFSFVNDNSYNYQTLGIVLTELD